MEPSAQHGRSQSGWREPAATWRDADAAWLEMRVAAISALDRRFSRERRRHVPLSHVEH